jgi:hypothetical protein
MIRNESQGVCMPEALLESLRLDQAEVKSKLEKLKFTKQMFYHACDVTLGISTPGKLEKYA